jgi:hypothetical protein
MTDGTSTYDDEFEEALRAAIAIAPRAKTPDALWDLVAGLPWEKWPALEDGDQGLVVGIVLGAFFGLPFGPGPDGGIDADEPGNVVNLEQYMRRAA